MMEHDVKALAGMGIKATKSGKAFVTSRNGTKYEVLGRLHGELEYAGGTYHWVLKYPDAFHKGGKLYITVPDFKWAIEYEAPQD